MRTVYAAVGDMIFASKIRGTTQFAQVEVEFFKNLEEILRRSRERRPDLLVLDLNNPKLDALEVVRQFKADADLASIPIVSFLSHVQVDLKKEAERLGCDSVLAKSQFNSRIIDILSGQY